MNNNTIPLYITVVLIILGLFACSKNNDIDLLNQRVNELIKLIEQHKKREIKDYLSKDFSAGKKFNKQQFFIFVHHQMNINKNILINVMDKKIILNKNYADVTANGLLIGSSDWLPERGQLYRIISRWEKENGEWKMSKLRWEKL